MSNDIKHKINQSQSGTGQSDGEGSWTYTANNEGQNLHTKVNTPNETYGDGGCSEESGCKIENNSCNVH